MSRGERIGLGFTNPGGTGDSVVLVGVWILGVDGRPRYLYIVLGICILRINSILHTFLHPVLVTSSSHVHTNLAYHF